MHALTRTDDNSAGKGPLKALDAAASAQYLSFMLGAEIFAINILRTKEIIAYGSLTEVPMMPDYIRGVINLRGAVVPVMDLAARFGKAAKPVTKWTCIVIVEFADDDGVQIAGLIVDAVNAVVEIARSEIEPAPAFGARIRSDFLEGMGKIGDRFAILLNVDRMLSGDELGALAMAATDVSVAASGLG